MRLYKFKVDETTVNKRVNLEAPALSQFVRIESIYFSSENPSAKLRLIDDEEDEVWYITGSTLNRSTILDTPITLKFPLSIEDDEGGNKVIIRGVVIDTVREIVNT